VIRSRVYLPKLKVAPSTVLEHLTQRFPHITESTWRDRMARGLVTTSEGESVQTDSPYAHGRMVFYFKEVPFEPAAQESETILYQDEEILIADKPHGMTVTPAGSHVARSLLNRLQERTGIEALTPMHRLDKDTAGIVMFSIKSESRGAYHELFATNAIRREYVAISRVQDVPKQTSWRVENRIGPGDPWYRQQIVAGPFNANTEIVLTEHHGDLGVFQLLPQTGKKHQLRLHMASIGCPILGDTIYGDLTDANVEIPLQLLARSLSFADPYSGIQRKFESERKLRSSPLSA
jgi:tRNA pseudouridine32 synthase/23S rRNA pseudouridine746 synthase